VEIKCQLDATEVFIADLIACSICFWHHYAHHQELKSIIQWLLSVVFGAVVFKLLVWCGAEGYVSGLQDAAPHQELKSIIHWLLPVVFRTVVFKLLVWCGAEGYVSGLQDVAASCKSDMPIIRSSRVLYSGCCLWYFVLWCSSCWSGVELRVMCPVRPDTTSWHFISTYFHKK